MERRSAFPTNQPHGIVGAGQDARPTGIDLRHKTVDFGKSTYTGQAQGVPLQKPRLAQSGKCQ